MTPSGRPRPIEIYPVPGIPEVKPGDDLAQLILDALSAADLSLQDGDVLAVTSKIVAKSEGRVVPLPPDEPERTKAREATIAAESVRTVARRGPIWITETHHGFVGANSLVYASNTGDDQLVLLPADPDASAAALRVRVAAATGRDVVVLLTDTLGRPWRVGQTDVAVGVAGMGVVEDYRGRAVDDGRVLEATEIAVADELASAAELVKRKTARTPVALVRGALLPGGEGRARDLVRTPADDLFRVGAGPDQLVHFLTSYRPCHRFTDAPVDDAVIERAVSAAIAEPALDDAPPLRIVQVATQEARTRYLDTLEPVWRRDLASDGASAATVGKRIRRLREMLSAAPVLLVPCLAADGDRSAPDQWQPPSDHETLAFVVGGAVQMLLLALHGEGLGAAWEANPRAAHPAAAAALDLPGGWRPLGSVLTGHPDPADRPSLRSPRSGEYLLIRR